MAEFSERPSFSFTADIVNADSLAVPQLAHCLLHFLHHGLGRKRGVFGQLLGAVEDRGVERRGFRVQELLEPLFPPK